ncbi:hypothetical protein SLA2020_258650 [Shorea laevis]
MQGLKAPQILLLRSSQKPVLAIPMCFYLLILLLSMMVAIESQNMNQDREVMGSKLLKKHPTRSGKRH